MHKIIDTRGIADNPVEAFIHIAARNKLKKGLENHSGGAESS